MTEACEQPIICRRNRVDDKADSIDLATPRKRKREPGKPGVPTIQTLEGRAGPAHFPQMCAQGPRDSAHRSAGLPRLGHSGAGLTRAGPAEPALPHPGLTRLGPQRTRGRADRPYLAWRASNSPWSPEVRLSTSRCSDSCTSARSASR